MSRLDQLYRRLLLTKFFTKGWGKPDNLKRLFEFRKILSNREQCQKLVSSTYPIHIDKEYKDGDCRILEGHLISPFIDHLPGIMPKEVEKASFQAIFPLKWKHPTLKPVCIHLAGTGDHYFWRRRLLTARPLLKEAGIASILLENPYYGSRKPKDQLRSSLHNVSDLFVMGAALVLESLALLHWCEREGWGPLGISGISMGGHMASGVASVWHRPLSLIPILSWTTASTCFTQGVMSGAIPWETLQEQFFENSIYQDEISKLIVSPERNNGNTNGNTNGNAYIMGKQFAKAYSQNVPQVVRHHHETFEHEIDNLESKNPQSSSNSDDQFHDNNVSSNADNLEDVSLSQETQTQINVNRTPTSSFFSRKTQPKSDNPGKQNVASNNSHSKSDTPSQISDTGYREEGSRTRQVVRKVRQSLTLNYAQTKESQQLKISNQKSDSKTLTFGHAQAKSKLSTSHRDLKNKVADPAKLKTLKKESYDFMIGVMDECTHLGNFTVPVDPELIIIISAKQDAYVPRNGVLGLDQLWPGCEVRYIDQGHVAAVVLHQAAFRKAIKDSFDKQLKKYYPDHIRKNKNQQYFPPQSRKAS